MMRVLLGLFLALASFAPALSQTDSRPISFEELNGTTIEAVVTLAQKIRNLKVNSVRNSNSRRTITLRIVGNTIEQANTNIVTGPNCRIIGTNSGSRRAVVNEPRKRRHGDDIWRFGDDRLDWLQIYQSGARRITVVFKRDGSGFACSIDAGLAPEKGAGAVRAVSGISKEIVEVLESKMVDSSCQVRKSGR
jgi:hypothetical protein